MAGGYESRPDGAELFTREFRDIWAAIRAISGANKLESAIIGAGGLQIRQNGRLSFFDDQDREIMALARGLLDQINPNTGGRALLSQGQLRLYGNYLNDDLNPARIAVDAGTDNTLLRMIPGYSDGDGAQNSFTTQGRRPGLSGRAWVYCDGRTEIHGDEYNSLWGERIEIVGGSRGVGVYGLPTTSAVANVRLATVGSEFTLALVSSSARYKTDPAPVEIDLDELRAVTGQTWVDRYELDNNPAGDLRRHVGLFAEHLDQFPSLRQFVDYDDQGRPDAIQYDRFIVALLELGKDHEARIVQLEADRDAQRERADAAEARADAMEARLAALEEGSNA